MRKRQSDNEILTKMTCPFRPKLSEKTNEIARRSKSIVLMSNDKEDIFDKLYKTPRASYYSSLSIQSSFSFHPQISEWEFSNKKDYVNQPILQRLDEAEKKRVEDLKKQREKKEFIEKSVDPLTKQKLHRPVISRGPKTNTRDKTNPLYQVLYKDKELADKKKQTYLKEQERKKALKEKNYSINNSMRMLQNSCKNKAYELFKLLDPDSCGRIHSKHIQLDCIKYKIHIL